MNCPACGTNLDGAINGNTDRPQDGAALLCGYCRALIVFSGSPVASLRYPTDEELRRFLADPEMQQTIAALGAYHRHVGGVPFPST